MLDMFGNNNLFKNTFRIPSARLQEWDYAATGYYFVTICTKNKQCWFGTIQETEEEPGTVTVLSTFGKIVEECWLEIPVHYPNATLDQYVIMPNHIHGIICIEGCDPDSVETRHAASLQRPKLPPRSLSSIINQFKSACTRHIHLLGSAEFSWQPRYYDHVVRNGKDLERIHLYISENTQSWLIGEDDVGM